MSAVAAGTLISSILVARNCRSTLERREKSGISRRSSTLVVTDRSLAWSASYHAPGYWYATGGSGTASVAVPAEDLTRPLHQPTPLSPLRRPSDPPPNAHNPSP